PRGAAVRLRPAPRRAFPGARGARGAGMTELVTRPAARTGDAVRRAVHDPAGVWSQDTTLVALALVAGALVPLVAPGSVTLDGPAATVYAAVAAVGLSI